MARYTFTCEHFDYNNWTGNEEGIASKHTTEFRADDLTTMLENFEMFLRGAGFHFNGRLDIVEEEEFSEITEEDDDFSQSSKEWSAIVNSMMNPPTFRANKCEVCGLDKTMMKSNKCYDDNCPVYAPQSVCKSEE